MNTYNRVISLIGLIIISACGGGGGGSGSSGGDGYGSGGGNNNNAPTINNSSTNIDVPENQTDAFTVSASDPDGDSLSYSISGTDSSIFNISMSGVVTFASPPDYESAGDENGDNLYEVIVTVTDTGSLTDNETFYVMVTNDPSDDVTTEGFDGTYIGAGAIQGATVCIEAASGTCTGAQFTTTTAQDGTFSLTVDSGTTGIIRAEGGFDPVTNLQFTDEDSMALSEPVTNQSFVVSPFSEIMNQYNRSTEYETFKTKLGVSSDFMIRFDNPYSNLGNANYNKAAVVNTQLIILTYLLETIHNFDSSESAGNKLASAIYSRTSDETSLGDTTFIKDLLSNLSTNFSPSSSQLVDLSAGISSYLQKVNANTSNSHSYFLQTGVGPLKTLMSDIMSGSATSSEIDKLTFETLDWINESGSWNGGAITDNESSLKITTYTLSNSGSSNYIVDNINTSSTPFVIYVKEGDVIQFQATNSVTSNHPFKISTEQNATSSDTGEIGTNEGWDQNTLTLTVGATTPDTLYPYCDYHTGMYSSGRIVKVSSYSPADIDTNNQSGAMQVKGTIATGPYKGASGFTYKVYLTSQGDSDHPHTFYEYPGLTFYMPDSGGYHGSETESSDTLFKPKSHFSNSSSDDDGY